MDITQIFIVISLTAISIAIVTTTYYLIALIKELQKAVTEVTGILEEAHQITNSVARPVSSFSEFLMGFQNGFKLFNSFFKKEDKEN